MTHDQSRIERHTDRRQSFQVGKNVTVYRRGKRGVYTADYHFIDKDGRRKHARKSLQTTYRRVAEQRARELDDALERGELGIGTPVSCPVETAVADFIQSKKLDGRAKKTILKYRGELTLFQDYLKNVERVTALETIAALHCDRYRTYRKTQHELDDYTLYTAVVVLKTFMKWCKSRALIEHDPLTDVKVSKPRRRRHPAATLQQFEGIQALATGSLIAIFATLAFTGLRVGELIALRPEDVDLNEGLVRVRHRDGWNPKTEGSEREVPIHRRLLAILKALPRAKGSHFFTAAPSRQFPKGDHQINPRDVNVVFQELASQCQFIVGRNQRGLTLHALRRFFKTLTLDSGAPKPLVDMWMGHQDSKSMDFFYYDPQRSKEWMERIPFGEPNDDEILR